jgi:hypothetical protein
MPRLPDEITNEDIWRLKLRLYALVWLRAAAAVFLVSTPFLAVYLDSARYDSPILLSVGLALLVLGGFHALLLVAIGKERITSGLRHRRAAVYGSMAIAASTTFMPLIPGPVVIFAWATIVLVAVAVTEFFMASLVPQVSRRLSATRSRWWVHGRSNVALLLQVLALTAAVTVVVLVLESGALGTDGTLMAGWLMLGAVLAITAPTVHITNTLSLARLVKRMDSIAAEDLNDAHHDGKAGRPKKQ